MPEEYIKFAQEFQKLHRNEREIHGKLDMLLTVFDERILSVLSREETCRDKLVNERFDLLEKRIAHLERVLQDKGKEETNG